MIAMDEIYGRIVYEGEHVSLASLPGLVERTIVLDGFSKTYAMTGWRLGYAIVPEPLLAPFSRLIINSVSCTSSFSQLAAIEALTGPQDTVEAMVEEFRARRTLVVDGLNDIPGLVPAAGRCVLRLPGHLRDRTWTAAFADRLLDETGVCVLAGTAFGQVGRDHIRISYANSRENLAEALQRIRGFVEGL